MASATSAAVGADTGSVFSNAATAGNDFRVITADEFEQFRRLAYEKAGLDLKRGKEQLVSARLGRKLRELNLETYADYYRHVVGDSTGRELVSLLDALTTNHTSFFREVAHFDFLSATVLPELRSRPKIGIWSAACSSGEEPYTLAFCLRDTVGSAASRATILATDISTKVLDFARRAIYPADRFGSIVPSDLRNHLLRGRSNGSDFYQIKPEVRQMIDFRRLNLMEDFSRLGTFPVIFCRNVMIYFDKPTQQSVVNRLADRLEPGGYLFIGHAESLNRIEHPLQYVQPAVYRKPGALGTS